MKTIIQLTLAILLLISCKDNNEAIDTYTDNNGTKSPRIKKVIHQSKEENYQINYIYNENNMLISKKSTLKDQYFSYNDDKQYDRAYGRKFVYSNILFKDTNLSSIEKEEYQGLYSSATYLYTYEMENNLAIKLVNINISSYQNGYITEWQCDYIYNTNKIIEIRGNCVNGNWSYLYNTSNFLSEASNSMQKILYTYNDKNLLVNKKSYLYNEEKDQFILDYTELYKYENKPYYIKQSPTYKDQGQYSNSGIY